MSTPTMPRFVHAPMTPPLTSEELGRTIVQLAVAVVNRGAAVKDVRFTVDNFVPGYELSPRLVAFDWTRPYPPVTPKEPRR